MPDATIETTWSTLPNGWYGGHFDGESRVCYKFTTHLNVFYKHVLRVIPRINIPDGTILQPLDMVPSGEDVYSIFASKEEA